MATKPNGPERNAGHVRFFGSKSTRDDSSQTIEEKRQRIRDLLAQKNKATTSSDMEEAMPVPVSEPEAQEAPNAATYLDDEDVEFVPERCDRKYMLQRFFGFIAEMMIFLPEGEWVNVGNKVVRIRRVQDSLTITLRDSNSGGIYRYRLIGDDEGVNNFQYAQYTETTTNSGKELTYCFTHEEESYGMIDFMSGKEIHAILLPPDLFERINRFENTVRGLLWKSKN